MTIQFRGHSTAEASDTVSTWSDTVALHADTQIGDGLVVAVSKWHLRAGTISTTDTRLTEVYSCASGKVYVGQATTLGGVTINYTGFPNGAFNESFIVAATWRNEIAATLTSDTLAGGENVTIPAHPTGAGAGAVAVLLGNTSANSYNAAAGYSVFYAGGTDAWSALAYTTDPTPPETVWQAGASSGSAGPIAVVGEMDAVVFNLAPLVFEAPPCRLFPRSDGLGVGSGRHFPPPKSQQRSGRRFGYY